MASYVVPQVEIHQLFSEIPVSLTQNQISFVFGPNFKLHRFDVPAEVAEDIPVPYAFPFAEVDGSSSTEETIKPFLKYQGALDPAAVDGSYTKLFGNKVIVKLMDLSDVSAAASQPVGGATKLVITLPETFPANRPLVAGDFLRIMYNDGTFLDTYVNDVEDDTSASDVDPSTFLVTVDDAFNTENISKVVLCEVQDGVEFEKRNTYDTTESKYNWIETKDAENNPGVEIQGQLYARVRDDAFRALFKDVSESYEDIDPKGRSLVLSAELYLTYRELLTAASDTIHAITAASEVADALGTVHPDNPLAQAVYNAALNAGGQTVRYMAVPENTLEGYNKVLEKATLTKEVYFLVPATRDALVLEAVKAHVNAMSAPTSKRWRIAFVSAEIPEEDPIYTATANTDGKDFYGKVLTDALHPNQTTVQLWDIDTDKPNPDGRFKKDLVKGDVLCIKFRKSWGEWTCTRFTIDEILNNNTIRVAGKYTQDAAEKIEIVHPYTNAEKAEVIRDLSSSFEDRRIYNVFPSVFSNGGVVQTGEFAAACVAGLVSSCLPQQPVTNLEIVGIDDIPLVYQTFSMTDLNTMASGGTFIVMQNLPNDQVYVRHQISTDYEANNLNTAELSITKNLDSISYFFDNLMTPYIGKYNITPELLAVIENVINQGLVSLESTSFGLYGPQLIADGTEILLIEQDALLKDHVNCNLKLNMPYPFNHLVLKLFV